jgi:hypothetical protein
LEVKVDGNSGEFNGAFFPYLVDIILEDLGNIEVDSETIGSYVDKLLFAGFQGNIPEF